MSNFGSNSAINNSQFEIINEEDTMRYTRMVRWCEIAMLAFATIFAAAAISSAQEMQGMKGMNNMTMDKSAKATTVQGEVIDMACYMSKGLHGSGHADCARACIKGGLPVGILDKTGHVYLCMTAKHESANSLLLPYTAEEVKATGTVYQKGGMDMLAVEKVEPLTKDKDANTK